MFAIYVGICMTYSMFRQRRGERHKANARKLSRYANQKIIAFISHYHASEEDEADSETESKKET